MNEKNRFLSTRLGGVLALALLTACTTPPPPAARPTALAGAEARPQRNVSSFTPSLRCMDDLLLKFGTRDIAIVLEEIQDKTQRINAGTREMMVAAIADVSRRSRAVRLIAFGSDSTNLLNLVQSTRDGSPFKVAPQFGLRGAITQFDADIQAERTGFGVNLGPILSIGAANEKFSTAIAFDASVMRTEDMALVPTAISKNVIVVTRRDAGVRDGQFTRERGPESSALISKVGIAFSMAVTSQDAIAQSVRGVVELAVLEVVGRLAMVPYWKCLGTDESHPDIQREIEDWFVVLERDEKLIAFVQEHLRTRRHFNGAADGKSSPALDAALAAVRKQLGLPAATEIDFALFNALMSDRLAFGPKAASPRDEVAAATAPTLELRTSVPAGRPGTPVTLTVATRTDQFVYCYRQSAAGAIERVFPNRFRSDPFLRANAPLLLPGKNRFALAVDRAGDATRFACIASPTELYSELPPQLRWGDFEKIGFRSFAEMRAAFEQTAGGRLAFVERAVRIQHP
jgi:hypothetical protein